MDSSSQTIWLYQDYSVEIVEGVPRLPIESQFFFNIMNLFSFCKLFRLKRGWVIKEKILDFLVLSIPTVFLFICMFVYKKWRKTVIYDRLLYDLYIYILFYRLILRVTGSKNLVYLTNMSTRHLICVSVHCSVLYKISKLSLANPPKNKKSGFNNVDLLVR